MLRPDLPSLAAALPFEPARVAAVAPADGVSAASPSFASLRAEIVDFIQHGSSAVSAATPSGPWSADVAMAAMSSPASSVALQALTRSPAATTDDGQRASFLASIAPLARQAGATLGVAPDILAAQAALETGWGRRPLRDATGADLHNLFGIKAGGGWPGASSDAPTTEFIDGDMVQKSQRFRRYADPAGAFDDLTRLLKTDPRYQDALNTGHDVQAYGEALARGGYATDPDYAAKLAAVVARLRADRLEPSR